MDFPQQYILSNAERLTAETISAIDNTLEAVVMIRQTPSEEHTISVRSGNVKEILADELKKHGSLWFVYTERPNRDLAQEEIELRQLFGKHNV